MGSKLDSPEERKRIEKIVWRLNVEVVKTMRKIPARELYGWKGDKE